MNILVEKKGPVTTIMINRPEKHNAVDGVTAAELADAFRTFERDETASVAVLTGLGRSFCAGADLKALAGEGQPNRTSVDGDGPMGPTRMRLSKPVIAAIAGYAVAGGMELALWCDMRIVEETAIMGIFCRRWGVPLVDGGTVRLPRIVGAGRAMDLILTGRPVEAEEAVQMGLANRIVANGTCRREAEALAAQIARFPQNCLRSDRLSAIEQWELNDGEAMNNEFRRGMETIASGEMKTGAAAFAGGSGRHGKFD